MITVTMAKEQWAAAIRLMVEGRQEGAYYVGRDAEVDCLISRVCTQTGITETEADEMEPPHDPYVPSGETP